MWRPEPFMFVRRPPELAQDDTPMIAVVQHVLAQIPGPENQIIVLLQPTQPLRTAAHVQAAITLLQETQVDSVVSVVKIPPVLHPAFQCVIVDGALVPWQVKQSSELDWRSVPTCRQHVEDIYQRDGTVYAFWRKTVITYGTIYGLNVRPLIISPEETCALDTLADWTEAERRLLQRTQ